MAAEDRKGRAFRVRDTGRRVLVEHASALRPLAAEPMTGRLRISPETVVSTSEVLGERAAREMHGAIATPTKTLSSSNRWTGQAVPAVDRSRS